MTTVVTPALAPTVAMPMVCVIPVIVATFTIFGAVLHNTSFVFYQPNT